MSGTDDCICGLKYRDFRTGLDFAEVRRMMWSNNPDPSTWRHKTRRMVLGHWHEFEEWVASGKDAVL